MEYNLAGPGWHSWVVGAQTHYSFFENLEKDQLHRSSMICGNIITTYGDVYSYDLDTGHVTLITHYTDALYLREQYLIDGDLLLLGAREFRDYSTTKEDDIEMWILHEGSLEPTDEEQKVREGVAISYESNKISWGNSHGQYPDEIEEGEILVYEAGVAYNASGYPSLANKHELFRSHAPECRSEPQDYRHSDTE